MVSPYEHRVADLPVRLSYWQTSVLALTVDVDVDVDVEEMLDDVEDGWA